MAGGVRRECPACGLESDEVRCPRCFTLKVTGCSGACTTCGDSTCHPDDACASDDRPSENAADDTKMTGTPLER